MHGSMNTLPFPYNIQFIRWHDKQNWYLFQSSYILSSHGIWWDETLMEVCYFMWLIKLKRSSICLEQSKYSCIIISRSSVFPCIVVYIRVVHGSRGFYSRVTFLWPDPTRPGETLTRPDPRLPTKSLTRPDPRLEPSPIWYVNFLFE